MIASQPYLEVTVAGLSQGAVFGLDNLWIADASVMPTIPSANTNLTTIVLAQRIADRLATA